MKLSQWRDHFIAWLSDHVEVNEFSWYLDEPREAGMTTVFIPPLRNIKNFTSDAGLRVTATQDVYITTRYPRELTYHQLPMSAIEGNYSSLAHLLLQGYQDISDILDLWFAPSEIPITVEEHGDDNGDWLVTQKYIIVFQAVSELEEPPADRLITKINFALYKEDIQETDVRLDYQYTTGQVLELEDGVGLVDDEDNPILN